MATNKALMYRRIRRASKSATGSTEEVIDELGPSFGEAVVTIVIVATLAVLLAAGVIKAETISRLLPFVR